MNLYITTSHHYNKIPKNDYYNVLWQNKKFNIIKEQKNICQCCNKYHKKLLYHIKLNDNFNMYKIICKFCYMILNVDYFIHTNEMILLYSKIPQKDIVRYTYDFIKNNGYVPLYTDIDPNVQRSQFSILEFLYIKNYLLLNEQQNYKIFITNNLDPNFISCISCINNIYNFSDNDSNDHNMDQKYNDQLNNLPLHILSNDEQININNILYEHKIYINYNLLNDMILYVKKCKLSFYNTTKQYNLINNLYYKNKIK